MWDLSAIVKQKQKNKIGKEIEPGAAHVLDIILRHWFLVDLSFQLPKSKDEDENEDNFSTKPNLDVKRKGLVPSP
jgi:hypothetical protein